MKPRMNAKWDGQVPATVARVSRRSFRKAAAAVAGTAAARAAFAAVPAVTRSSSVDVIVVGAGFAYDWSVDPWTRGCPVGYMATGVLTEYGPSLRVPVGRIHWAGTETAEVWNGYMDGAVRSGLRAAQEVLTAYGRSPKCR